MNASAFRFALMRWYDQHGRDLPWRRTRDPYAVLVSEFMLQQTQVATVAPHYNEWLERFPDFVALARARESTVLRSWEGLGYYARARNLHATAKIVADRHRGRLPKSINALRHLPGIGKYTAHALATFAFDRPVPIVEVNTSRVLARLFSLRIPIDSTAGEQSLWDRANTLVPAAASSIYNSALIDLGALICLPRNPKCGACPVRKFCRCKNPALIPVKKSRPPTKRLIERHAFSVRGNKLLLHQSDGRWRGMWVLPQSSPRAKGARAIHVATFPFTNHQITLEVFRQRAGKDDRRQRRWFAFTKLNSVPIPSPHRRAIDALLD
jgi:A/G-specific adenine glycosylase